MLRGKYKGRYTQEQVELAVQSVKQGGSSINNASRVYSVPRATLFDKLNNRTKVRCPQGRPTVLKEAEEKVLAEWVINMARIGYGRTKQELCFVVKKILEDDNRPNPFTDNLPGRHWIEGFLKRHENISLRTGEALGKERAYVTSQKLDKWFADYVDYLTSSVPGGEEVMQDPTRIFNADESGFPLAGKSEKVLAEKGSKNVYNLTTSDKSQITVLACCSASGMFIPPMLIFPGIRFMYDPLRGAPDGSFLGRSSNGWIDSEIFFEWLANHFYPHLVKEGIKFPVVLLVDGHASHINLETANFCNEKKIVLYCLPPHASHIMQPLDVSVFGSLKNRWSKEVRNFQLSHPGENITKQTFSGVFKKAWEYSTTPENATSGFRKCGLFPLDKDNIDKSRMLPSQVFIPSHSGNNPGNHSGNVSGTVSDNPSGHADTPPHNSDNASVSSALHEVEAVIDKSTLDKFKRRLSEGYDLPPELDPLYTVWKKLKGVQASTGGPSTSSGIATASNTPTVNPPSQTVPTNVFAGHLRYPSAPPSKKRRTREEQALPKAISGDKYRAYLAEKEKKKQEEEAAKAKRKADREAKQASKKQANEKRGNKIDTNICSKCRKVYDNQPQHWIGCDCGRWFHKGCTEVPDLDGYTDEEIEDLEWMCTICVEE